MKYVQEQFDASDAPLNTILKPAAYYYNLALWSRYSGSVMARCLFWFQRLQHRILAAGLMGLGLVAFAAGTAVRRVPAVRPSWVRLMSGVLMGSTGFCAMSLEIMLIFLFQGLYGHVYTRIGLIVAVFMAGLVLGAFSGRFFGKENSRSFPSALVLGEVVILTLILGVPFAVKWAAGPAVNGGGATGEWLICAGILVLGWAVGMEFPLLNRLYRSAGGTVGTAAAVTDASDHIGAAAGAFLTGAFLVPVLGIGGVCIVLAGLKGAALLVLASALMNRNL